MMQVEFLQSWQDYSSTDSSYEQIELIFADKHEQLGNFEFPSSMSVEDCSNVSSSVLVSSPVFADGDLHYLPHYGHDSSVMFPMEQCFPSLKEVGTPTNDQLTVHEFEGLSEWTLSESGRSSQLSSEEDAISLIISPATIDVSSVHQSLIFPSEDVEVDHQLSFLHLLKAYGDAREMEQKDLTDEIARRLEDKASPVGTTLERLAYYLVQQASEKQVDYLSKESSKNYDAAFRAFYQIFPYGRFPHFTANSAILEGIPEDACVIHIVDFDVGKGVQWPPLIEELGRRGKSLVKLTSIKWEEDEESTFFPPMESFQETRKRLCEHARSCGVTLKVEEMDMEGLMHEMKKSTKRGGRNEWLAFNCLVGLPHMGRVRSIRHVLEFLKVAKDSVNNLPKEFNNGCRGIVTVGNVNEVQTLDSTGFESFFEGKLVQLQAFFESIESHFPGRFAEARTSMEYHFMAPQVCFLADLQNWEEIKELSEIRLEAWRMSSDNILEAKRLVVREGEGLFWVKTGENENQMILGYMGTPLVKVSSWRL